MENICTFPKVDRGWQIYFALSSYFTPFLLVSSERKILDLVPRVLDTFITRHSITQDHSLGARVHTRYFIVLNSTKTPVCKDLLLYG